MSKILALSFDCPSSPSILLKCPESSEQNQPYGRGFCWYNNEELSITVVKEAKFTSDSTFAVMQDFSKFHSSIFIGHIRGAAKRLVQKDTQPFSQTYAGRDWVFVHSGDLRSGYEQYIPIDKNSSFEPLGSTDSERMFCFILDKIKQIGARSLADVDRPTLYSWLTEINKLGTANIMLSDGTDMVVYHDANSFNPLYWLRSYPPHKVVHFEADSYTIDITSPFDIHHTFVLVSNDIITQTCITFSPSQMIVLRRGKITWNSLEHAELVVPNPEVSKRLSQEKIVEVPKYEIERGPAAAGLNKQIADYINVSQHKFFSVVHETKYSYDEAISLSKHLFNLHPQNDHIQNVLDYKLLISVPGYGEFFEDVFGNISAFYRINTSYNELIIRSESIVSIAENPSLMSETLHQRRDIPLVWLPSQRQMMSPYLLPPELPESELSELIEFAMSFVKRNDYDLMEALDDINQTIYRDFEYVPKATSLTTTPYQLYMTRRGVCQDFTNLFICLARLLNVPARYRAGYIYVGSDIENQIQSEASHAWVELYLPYIGWYGFDPTNGCIVKNEHIRVACGRNYIDAAPTSGTIYKGGGKESLDIYVKVKSLENYPIKHPA